MADPGAVSSKAIGEARLQRARERVVLPLIVDEIDALLAEVDAPPQDGAPA